MYLMLFFTDPVGAFKAFAGPEPTQTPGRGLVAVQYNKCVS